MMEYFEKLFVENWPTWFIIVFTAGGIYRRVITTENKVTEIKKNCEKRLLWCIDHFCPKDGKQPPSEGGS